MSEAHSDSCSPIEWIARDEYGDRIPGVDISIARDPETGEIALDPETGAVTLCVSRTGYLVEIT